MSPLISTAAVRQYTVELKWNRFQELQVKTRKRTCLRRADPASGTSVTNERVAQGADARLRMWKSRATAKSVVLKFFRCVRARAHAITRRSTRRCWKRRRDRAVDDSRSIRCGRATRNIVPMYIFCIARLFPMMRISRCSLTLQKWS